MMSVVISKSMQLLLLQLLGLLIVSTITLALPADKANGPLRDDLTSDYAKQIIRLAKVAEVKNLLNTKVAPCDNFFNYACGNWQRQYPAQLFKNLMTDNFQHISGAFDQRLQRLLLSGQLNSSVEEKLSNFYQSCLRLEDDKANYKLTLHRIHREFGGLPASMGATWNASSFNWWQTVAQIAHKYGKQIVLAVDVMVDLKNHTTNRIYLSPTNSEIGSNSDLIDKLENSSVMQQLMNNLGISEDVAEQTAKQINTLERKLVAVGNDDNLTIYKLDEVQQMFGTHINLTEFLGLVLGVDNVPSELYLNNRVYLENALLTLNSEEPAQVANFVLWKLLDEYLEYAKEGELAKWCITKTKKYFGKLTDHIVYESYRSAESEADVFSMWEKIRLAFRQQLEGDKLDWIANRTRELAVQKLDSMQLHINSYDNVNFEELYGNLTMDRLDYVSNVQELLIAQGKQSLDRLHKQPASLEDTETLSFTPAYNIMENSITIPVAMMQPRFFWDANYPQAFKYATLGFLLAHEMVHGFDDEGRKYNAVGAQENWWDDKSLYEYEEKRKCFQAQYHDFKYANTNLPDSREQAENIADNAGVKLAFTVYRNWLEQQPPAVLQRETFSDLPFNSRQLFFVAYAQLWCDDVHSLLKSSVAASDSHAPSQFRVIGSLSNFQEFSWVFNCPQQAAMDPDFKCAIY